MKIMFYSQHVLGIGHFFRSMEIAAALAHHEVLFVEGGEPLAGFEAPSHVKRTFLPTLMMDAEFKSLEANGADLDAIKAKRSQLLWNSFFHFSPDVLVTELFPFGRKQFRFELMPLLTAIRKEKMPTRVVCSLRDILVEKKDQSAYEEGVLLILNQYYDLLLLHADPTLVCLEETFERSDRIAIPIKYTGFVTRRPPPRRRPQANGRRVVASSGGGKVGVELLASTIKAFRLMSGDDIRLRVFMGPFMEPADRRFLAELASKDPRAALLPFAPDFLTELAEADLSVSMAGYNTCMDILASGVRAVVHPFGQNREQAMRARKLERLGLLRVIESLEPDSLLASMHLALEKNQPSAASRLNLDGAKNAAAILERYMGPEAL